MPKHQRLQIAENTCVEGRDRGSLRTIRPLSTLAQIRHKNLHMNIKSMRGEGNIGVDATER